MPYVNKPRPYKKEYEQYQGTEEQKKNRAMRNAARRKAMQAGKVAKGDGKDVAHKKAISKGGTNGDGVRVESKSANRSFDRDSKNKLVSELSPRERKSANRR
jgi:hypothetical protein